MSTVTMQDVAAAAGVSVASVSRVLAGRPGVGQHKQKVILDACAELNYRYDAVAAALSSGSTSSVGILIPDITNPFFPAVVQAAERELAADNLDIVFADSGNDVGTEELRLRTLTRRRVDALLVCPVDTDRSIPALSAVANATRVIQLDRCAIDALDFVGVDHRAGMEQIVDHLVQQGARSAVFVGGNKGMSTIMERADSFETLAQAAGLKLHRKVTPGFPDLEYGRVWMQRLLQEQSLPDALVCANDEVAAGVLLELRRHGLSSPNDVLVTGYDDVPFAEILGLTTIRQPLPELGREAARLLKQQSSAPRHVLLQPTLVVRSTTRPGMEF